jgi:predicted unusual protein kinase regulating ubiquinone biosynthesis (AarF/ABC1/UbiB family)
MVNKKKLHKIETSVLSRSLKLAKLTINTGAHLGAMSLKKVFKNDSQKEELWKNFLKDRALEWSQDLGELKGSLMKAGQLLSMYGEHFLPTEANHLLKSLQSQSPAIDWTIIEKILLKELGEVKLKDLEIEKESIGSASLGQVHRARIKGSNQQIALKVQYPLVRQAIDSDLKALKSLLKLMKLIPQNIDIDPLFEEVKIMMDQETNYVLEKENTRLYKKQIESDSRYVLPDVIEPFCTNSVLATTYELGLAVDDPIVMKLPQERRNRLASLFLELYFKELFEWGFVQTDPHLGNYRIRLQPDGQDQIILLDFGAVRKYDEKFLTAYKEMIKSAVLGDIESLNKAASLLDFIRPGDSAEVKNEFISFCLATVEPFTDTTYDWKNTDLPQRLTQKAFKMVQKFPLRTPPKELLFLDRKTGGVFIFCSVMQAKMNSRHLLLKFIDKMN